MGLFAVVGLNACNDDNDLPNVDFSLEVSGGVCANDTIYAVAGKTLAIKGIKVDNNESGKGVGIPYADYFLDYRFIARSVVSPYGINIPIAETPVLENHYLEIYAPVYAEGKSPAYAVLYFTVKIVASEDDLPQKGEDVIVSKFTQIQEDDPLD